jgi:hypothetical protein
MSERSCASAQRNALQVHPTRPERSLLTINGCECVMGESGEPAPSVTRCAAAVEVVPIRLCTASPFDEAHVGGSHLLRRGERCDERQAEVLLASVCFRETFWPSQGLVVVEQPWCRQRDHAARHAHAAQVPHGQRSGACRDPTSV